MADISMCADRDCPSRADCHRWCAWPDGMRQSYADFGRERWAARCGYYMIRRDGDRTARQAELDMTAGQRDAKAEMARLSQEMGLNDKGDKSWAR